MIKKYVLEIGRVGEEATCAVDSRILYDDYNTAKQEFDATLKLSYAANSLTNQELISRCFNVINAEQEYIDSWLDKNNDLCMLLYKVLYKE